MSKLFEENAYLKDFKAKIININIEEKTIELDNTAFYARSGGQPGDTGEIIAENQNIEVKDTIKKDNKIINIINKTENLDKGIEIIGKIDWEKRYKHMKMHSALHLMCSVIPLGVTGGQIGYEKSRLDFNDPDKEIKKEQLQENINTLMKEDHKIMYEYIDSKILESQPELVRTMSVKPPNINGKLRFVKIGNIDFQPCGGTHVRSTVEIGEIKIGKIENKGKMNRRVNILLND